MYWAKEWCLGSCPLPLGKSPFLDSEFVNCQLFYISIPMTHEVSYKYAILSFPRADCTHQTLLPSVPRGSQSWWQTYRQRDRLRHQAWPCYGKMLYMSMDHTKFSITALSAGADRESSTKFCWTCWAKRPYNTIDDWCHSLQSAQKVVWSQNSMPFAMHPANR